MGGGSKQTTEVKDTSPWTAQQPYLLDAFESAKSIFDSNKSSGPYTGEFFATPEQSQIDTFNNALNFSNGQGATAVNTQLNAGTNQVNSGTSAVNSALSGLNDFAHTDQTAGNIAHAQQYASGLDLDSLTQAGMYAANRNAAENTLPTLYRGANATGNTDSDRTALMQGVVQRGLAEQAQNLRSTLGASAYQNGLQSAQGDNAQRLAALQGQAGAGQSAVNSGQSALSAGIANRGALTDLASVSAGALQGFKQSAIDNERAKYDYAQAQPYANLQQYMSVVGGQNWGSHTTGTSVTEDKPSALSTIGTGVGALGSLFKMFSDERLKTVTFRNVGTTAKGVPLHLYYYNSDKLRRPTIGPIAQEVRELIPEAVEELMGYLVVDYSLI